MTASTRLERDLTDWLSETAMPQTPDYADDILEVTSQIHQRPRWSFVGRWLPIGDVRPRFASGATLRAVALLVLLGLLLAAIAAFVGSRREVLRPFGLAGTGLLAGSRNGDIVLVDAGSGVTQTIVSGADTDEHPRWSPDGTRIAFLRRTESGVQSIVIADQSGRILAISDSIGNFDTDTLRWSPDSTQIAIATDSELGTGIHLVDAATGAMRRLKLPFRDGEFFWRPPDGHQLLFASREPGSGLALGSVADGSVDLVPTGDINALRIRILGWTPDGRRVLFQADDAAARFQTIVVDVDTGARIHLDVGFGHVSNDGTRVAGVERPVELGRLCVVAITGGTCKVVADDILVEGSHGASVSWSPDDRWITVLGEHAWIVDPLGVEPPRALSPDGPGSWQRIAP